MFTFRVTGHSIYPGVRVVEVIENGEVVGAIYPTELGLKIVSRYLMEDPEGAVRIERGKLPPIPAVLINLHRDPSS